MPGELPDLMPAGSLDATVMWQTAQRTIPSARSRILAGIMPAELPDITTGLSEIQKEVRTGKRRGQAEMHYLRSVI